MQGFPPLYDAGGLSPPTVPHQRAAALSSLGIASWRDGLPEGAAATHPRPRPPGGRTRQGLSPRHVATLRDEVIPATAPTKAMLEHWQHSYRTEQAEFESLMLLAQIKMAEAKQATEAHDVGRPNKFVTVAACEILDRIESVFGRYSGVIAMVKAVLLDSIFVGSVDPTATGTAYAELTPYYEVARAAERERHSAEERCEGLSHNLHEVSTKGKARIAAIAKIAARWQGATLRAAFQQWRVYVADRRFQKQRHTKFLRRWHNRRLYDAFCTWRDNVRAARDNSAEAKVVRLQRELADLRKDYVHLQTEHQLAQRAATALQEDVEIAEADKTQLETLRAQHTQATESWATLCQTIAADMSQTASSLLKKLDVETGDPLFAEREMAGLEPEEVLMRWVNHHLSEAGYDDNLVANFSTDWKGGWAYLALLGHVFPEHCDANSALEIEDPGERAKLVVQAAAAIGVSGMTVEDILLPDERRVHVAFLASVMQKAAEREAPPSPSPPPLAPAASSAIERAQHQISALMQLWPDKDLDQEKLAQVLEEYKRTRRVLDDAREWALERRRLRQHTVDRVVQHSRSAVSTRIRQLRQASGSALEVDDASAEQFVSIPHDRMALLANPDGDRRAEADVGGGLVQANPDGDQRAEADVGGGLVQANPDGDSGDKRVAADAGEAAQAAGGDSEQIQHLRSVLYSYAPTLRNVYRFYAKTNAMNSTEFREFARDCRIEGGNLGTADLDLIFVRCNWSGKDGGKDDNPERELVAAEFAEALLRIANLKYRKTSMTIAERFERLVDEVILPRARQTDAEQFRQILVAPPMQAVYRRHRARLLRTFKYYAALDVKTAAAKRKVNTIGTGEFVQMCKDAKLIDSHFTLAKASGLYASAQEIESELGFAGFLEVIAAVGISLVTSPYVPHHVRVETFFVETLYPRLAGTVKGLQGKRPAALGRVGKSGAATGGAEALGVDLSKGV